MKFNNIKIKSPDPERLLEFYRDQLDLLQEPIENGAKIKIGASSLTIEKGIKNPDQRYHFAFNIHPALYGDAIQFLHEKKIPLILNNGQEEIDFPDWNAYSVYFRDPDGNILEFIARFNLEDGPIPEEFDAASIWNISEVGLPVANNEAFVRAVQEHTDAPVWKSYGPGFQALGDEEGLLIVSSIGRDWFPTTDPAVALSLRVEIDAKGTDFTYDNMQFRFLAAQ
jgi:hypothetical protein